MSQLYYCLLQVTFAKFTFAPYEITDNTLQKKWMDVLSMRLVPLQYTFARKDDF